MVDRKRGEGRSGDQGGWRGGALAGPGFRLSQYQYEGRWSVVRGIGLRPNFLFWRTFFCAQYFQSSRFFCLFFFFQFYCSTFFFTSNNRRTLASLQMDPRGSLTRSFESESICIIQRVASPASHQTFILNVVTTPLALRLCRFCAQTIHNDFCSHR